MGMNRTLVTAAALAICLAAGTIDSCTFDNPPLLEFDNRPDAPLDRYVAGRLGIIEQTYARSYLVVAYRYLIGHPLTAADQKGVVALVKHRLALQPTRAADGVPLWLAARKEVPNVKPVEQLEVFRSGATYDNYMNCTSNAFTTAAATLRARIASFGAASKAVASWLTAQDEVFANCNGTSGLPRVAEASLPKIIRKDRDYQMAAASFYSEDFEDAHKRFAEIAADADSPWAATSALVAVRCRIRSATLDARSGEPYDMGTIAAAEVEVDQFLADRRYASLHPSAQRLRQYIRIRTKPDEVFAETAERLANGTSGDMANDLADYTILLDKKTRHDPLTDWIENMQSGNVYETLDKKEIAEAKKKEAAAYEDAVARWHASHELPWLVAAVTHATGQEASAHEILEAAKGVRSDSPAFVTVAYHRLRLLPYDDPDYRPLVDSVLALKDDLLPPGARNDFRGLRLPLSRSLDEFLRDAPRQVTGYYDQSDPDLAHPQWLFNDDAAKMLNQSIPLDELVRAAGDKNVPAPLNRMLLVAAFTRAHLLGRDDVALALAPRLSKTFPEVAKPLLKFVSAAPAERKWEGIELLVHFPGLQPFLTAKDNRLAQKTKLDDEPHTWPHDNWWCLATKRYETSLPQLTSLGIVPQDTPVDTPTFAEAPEVAQRNRKEQEQLTKLGSGSTCLLNGVVAWSNAHPKDPRLPEAMARAIKTARWACPDPQTRAAAAAAFKLLHARYPKSPAAQETRYWYDGAQ